MELYQHKLLTITFEPELAVAKLAWTEATAAMTAEDFKHTVTTYTELVEKHHAQYLLIDVNTFRFNVDEELGKWHVQHISPRYNKAGIKKKAFVVGKDATLPPSREVPAEKFVTTHVHTEEDAIAWFKNNS
ncbi:MAG: hypothetical protein GY801_15050 [bacterium]|nr:hypothetical protein [bacterium]